MVAINKNQETVTSTKKFGHETIKTIKEKTIEVSGFDYNPAFCDEMRNIGGNNTINRFTFVFTNEEQTNRRIDEICNYYWCNGKSMTDGQRKLRDRIIEYMENPDLTFKKDNYGLAFYDLNEISGSPKEIKKELQKVGIIVDQIRNNRRIYVKN